MSINEKKLIQQLIKKSSNPELIESAFEFAKTAYKDKFMFSGENHICHALRVALMLEKMNLDPKTIAFGLMHDVLDDKSPTIKEVELKVIEKKFGKDIGQLLQKISELRKMRYTIETNIEAKKKITREKLENTRKMFLAIAGDLRVVIVELISRLDALKSFKNIPEARLKLQSIETLQIFVPIARRLGLNEIRRELEDISFSYLFPKKFTWLKKNIEGENKEREKYLKRFIVRLKKIFKKERIGEFEINYRTKSYWSTYKKLYTHDMDFNKVHDLFALRIITNNTESCYKILGIIHKHFKPISEEIDDYIAKPKPNGYRSLHTTVFSNENKITEIQIRTKEMHEEAEHGVCAHWSYKEKIDLKKEKENFEWMKDISEFWENFKIDFFPQKIFTFTPRGDIIVLPKGSCPIDFAYAVHSDIGNHCELAKIGGKIVPLSHVLENGDIVEITTNKKKSPSQDWLKFVKTGLAKSHIKKFTTEKETGFKFPIPGFIKRKFIEISEIAKKRREEKQVLKKGSPRQIYIAGQKGMLTHVAKCCNPQPGDKVKAYLTKQRVAVLHLKSCENFKKLSEQHPERVIDASWE